MGCLWGGAMKYSVGMMMCLTLGSLCLSANELQEKLEKLMQFRVTPKSIVLDYNPFINEKTIDGIQNGSSVTEQESKKQLALLSIMNQKAFISGQWYEVNDRIDDGKIVKINSNSVQIKQGNKLKTLTFESSKSLLHVKDTLK
jgi:hypothetical protein